MALHSPAAERLVVRRLMHSKDLFASNEDLPKARHPANMIACRLSPLRSHPAGV